MTAQVKSQNVNINSYAKNYSEEQTVVAAEKLKKKRWYDSFKTLFSMVKDKEFSMQTTSYVTITGALAYVVLPTDIVPDFIPMLGWVDDAMVIKLVVDSARGEIARYNAFKGFNNHIH